MIVFDEKCLTLHYNKIKDNSIIPHFSLIL
jgi:hypothetical protein